VACFYVLNEYAGADVYIVFISLRPRPRI